MSNTYTQIHIQVVFAVQNRLSLISQEWKNRLYMYITSIIQKNGHKLVAINGTADHVHILFGMRPTQSLSELMKEVKGCSSKWINDERLVNGKFSWQEGYGAFSYGKSQIPMVINYINNQEEHHKKTTFLDEYKKFLELYGIQYDEQYIFKPIE
ncbi:MAG: IS200/IS605 family transposase [Salinivirgaceae bacterium]|nr:IS200/IS605 family transposase [Salinivirgaceae bacterium]